MAFANVALLPCILDAMYLPRGISHHTPLQIMLQLSVNKFPYFWCLNPDWVAESTDKLLVTEQQPAYRPTNSDSSTS